MEIFEIDQQIRTWTFPDSLSKLQFFFSGIFFQNLEKNLICSTRKSVFFFKLFLQINTTKSSYSVA